jgi:hypothetical protein
MRFSEFNSIITETADAKKYYAIGDQHASGLVNADPTTWSLGGVGIMSNSGQLTSAINSIPPGSVVAISTGQNDALKSTDSPEQIASRISSLVMQAKSRQLNPVYMLFPSGGNKRLEQIRDAIQNELGGGSLVDLGGAPKNPDNLTLSTSGYQLVARSVANKVKPISVKVAGSAGATGVAGTGQPLASVDSSTMATAKASADRYLGRALTPIEWDNLLRATFAEASRNTEEEGYVMAVILNRVRVGKGGNDVVSVLNARKQFQSVTGTSHAPGHSSNFDRGPDAESLKSILSSAISILPRVDHRYLYFTAASKKAFGPGTDIKMRDAILANGGIKIGGSVFGTKA